MIDFAGAARLITCVTDEVLSIKQGLSVVEFMGQPRLGRGQRPGLQNPHPFSLTRVGRLCRSTVPDHGV